MNIQIGIQILLHMEKKGSISSNIFTSLLPFPSKQFSLHNLVGNIPFQLPMLKFDKSIKINLIMYKLLDHGKSV